MKPYPLMNIPARMAIIDLGTNSVRLDIHEIFENRATRLLFREKWMVRLGEQVFMNGALFPEAMERTLLVFEKFADIFEKAHVTTVHAYATSALRDASNKKEFLDAIKERSGIVLKILSGQQEAVLIAGAIISREKMPKASALIDIGGGSTEISLCKGKQTLQSKSLLLGAARLQQVFLRQIPPTENSVLLMRNYIRRILAKNFPSPSIKPQYFLGSSGTVKGACKILRPEGHSTSFSLSDLTVLNRKMSTMTKAELLRIPRMEAKRTDLILAGSILLEECLRHFKTQKVRYTPTALRDGILDSVLRKSSSNPKPRSCTLEQLSKLSNAPLQLAEHIFQFFGDGNGISAFWKDCFFRTCMVYRLGEKVSPFDVGDHSVYMLHHLGLRVFTDRQSPYGFLLCKWHDKEEISPSDLSTQRTKNLPPAFYKILALLQLHFAFAKSLDDEDIQINVLKLNRRLTTLQITKKSPSLLLLHVEQHKKLYEKTFKTMLLAVAT